MKTTKIQSKLESDRQLCQRYDIACQIVGDIYDVGLDDKPLSESDRCKWMVTTPANAFPDSLVQAIPLAETEHESEALAVEYLMLRNRSAFLSKPAPGSGGAPQEGQLAIPTAVYLAFIYDQAFWPRMNDNLVYGVDVVLEVDGRRWEQPDLEPATFEGTKDVKIVEGMVFEGWTPLHSLFDHFVSWITGHRPIQKGSESQD